MIPKKEQLSRLTRLFTSFAVLLLLPWLPRQVAKAGTMKTKENIAFLPSATVARSNAASPLPCTRGRGVGVRGLQSPAKLDIIASTMPPSPPTPLPRVQGRGETE